MSENEGQLLSIQYTDACRTGIAIIDTEHEHLFELMNQVVQSIHRPEIDMISLEEYVHILLDYGETHFKHEEENLENIHDRELVHQQLAHRMFMNKVKAIDLHGLTEDEKKPLVMELMDYSIEWLYKHILYSDILIGKIVHRADTVKPEDIIAGQEVMYCPFDERLHTGDAKTDEQHREWFALLNVAYNILEINYNEAEYDHEMGILDELESKMISYFNEEENKMHDVHYPDYHEHQNAHSACMGRLSERDLAHDEENPKEYIEEMLDFLYAWLVNHILKMDKPLIEYINNRK